ncbi:protein of unknown function (DUF1736) [Halocaridina rubra]|uniref:Uncharacterized protein n=1 Tax=Halocaridina rubra TaxID=373956 RepID=A0AAN8X8L2_HALRR
MFIHLRIIYENKLWPEYSSAHNNLATLLNDTSKAEEHFRLALKAHPQYAKAYYNLASLKKRQGIVREAMFLLEKSLINDATNKDTVSALAALYMEAARENDAQQLHLTLLRARPYDPVIHVNYAAFLHTIEEEPNNRDALFQLSLLYSYTNRTHEALVIAHRATAAQNCSTPLSSCAHLHAHYADLLKESYRDEEALHETMKEEEKEEKI